MTAEMLYGVREVSLALGVFTTTLEGWLKRHDDTPEPSAYRAHGRLQRPLWDAEGLAAWHTWHAGLRDRKRAGRIETQARQNRPRPGLYNAGDVARELGAASSTIYRHIALHSPGIPDAVSQSGKGFPMWDDAGLALWRKWWQIRTQGRKSAG